MIMICYRTCPIGHVHAMHTRLTKKDDIWGNRDCFCQTNELFPHQNFSVRNGGNYVAASVQWTVWWTLLMFCGGRCSREERERQQLLVILFCKSEHNRIKCTFKNLSQSIGGKNRLLLVSGTALMDCTREAGPCGLKSFQQLCQVGWMSFGWWTILDT